MHRPVIILYYQKSQVRSKANNFHRNNSLMADEFGPHTMTVCLVELESMD